MERPKLPDGLVWRKRPGLEGSYFEDIYFEKKHRNRRIRGSSGTSDPQEVARRLAVEKILQRPPLQLIVGQVAKGPHDLEQRIA